MNSDQSWIPRAHTPLSSTRKITRSGMETKDIFNGSSIICLVNILKFIYLLLDHVCYENRLLLCAY